MGVSPSQVNRHTKSYSCSKQSVPEETSDYGISEQKHNIRSETVQREPVPISTIVSPVGASEALKLSSEDDIKITHTENSDPQSKGACKSSLTDKSSGLKLTAVDQKLEFGSEDTHGELGVVGEHSGPAKGKSSLGSGVVKEDNALLTFSANEALQLLPAHIAKNSLTMGLELPCEDAINRCHQLSTSEQKVEFASDDATCDPLEESKVPASDLLRDELVEINNELSCCTATRHLGTQLTTKSSPLEHLGMPSDSEINTCATEKLEPPHDNMDNHLNLQQSDTPSKDVSINSSRVGVRVKRTAKSTRKKYVLRSLRRSDRVRQSRSQEKPKGPDPNADMANASSNIEKTRKKRKKRQRKSVEGDEYSRIRKHLRYLLNRISYEQSLITAYSAEGWKGLSLEKLKPEKELQRATSEILRRKLKIRDLFQRVDSLCAEGRLPESLFDSDGQISSEDIFCAKCGSKDMTADNDIILCDGACDRGFHQFCLLPPLLKEDIPPDDEGWLCPGCDCKVDCIELLNDSQGTNISISDRWEKVFPEAAAAGQNPDPNFGLPSDDSDDNDYDPDGPEIDEKSQGDESSNDESDYTSASDELEASPGDEQQLGLSSDDSEDDDYDPDALDRDENVEESSSSDFTSDSEDLTATLDDNHLSGEDENHMSIGLHGDSKHRGNGKQSTHSELSLLDLNSRKDGSGPISGKRDVERLDYKKLYDETYGNASSDSSDDEDFTDDVEPRKRRKETYGSTSSDSSDDEDFIDDVEPRKRRRSTEVGQASVNANAFVSKTAKQDTTPKRHRQKSKFANTSTSSTKGHEGASPSSSSGKPVKSSGYRRLGETVTQGLYKSFKENQYPDRAKKESLAKELGITFQQVSKWFENTRWSFNHPPSTDASTVRKTTKEDSQLPKTNTELCTPEPEKICRNTTSNGAQSEESPKVDDATGGSYIGDTRDTKMGSQESCKQKSKTPDSRKRKHISDPRTLDPYSTIGEMEKIPVNLPKSQEKPAGGRTTRSKSVA
ncbi:hypothetical protein JCGZ_16279 [Jatropha curcas]|uniref:Uncharacterized protein n=2 Tax=Jatropha curcas TaxID=180498 RepID=A0A067L7L0_JATCU|nr:hypothetical protein JCGZ_16279 [Jatropha curcas]